MVQLQVQKKISKNRKVTENVILKKKKDNTAKKKGHVIFLTQKSKGKICTWESCN